MPRRRLAWGASFGLFLTIAATPAAQAQARFDLRDWARKPIAENTTALFECKVRAACGEGSAVSARQAARPKEPVTIAGQRAREQAIVKRMKEQSEGRIKDVELGETRETIVEGLPLIYTEKKIIRAKGEPQIYLTGVMTGKTRAYTIIASGRSANAVRSNFQGLSRVVALILGELAVEASKSDKP
jgi:hypothetical protein